MLPNSSSSSSSSVNLSRLGRLSQEGSPGSPSTLRHVRSPTPSPFTLSRSSSTVVVAPSSKGKEREEKTALSVLAKAYAQGHGLDLSDLALVHEVSRTDSIASIALYYGISSQSLRQANALWASDSIALRRHLLIPILLCTLTPSLHVFSLDYDPTTESIKLHCRVERPPKSKAPPSTLFHSPTPSTSAASSRDPSLDLFSSMHLETVPLRGISPIRKDDAAGQFLPDTNVSYHPPPLLPERLVEPLSPPVDLVDATSEVSRASSPFRFDPRYEPRLDGLETESSTSSSVAGQVATTTTTTLGELFTLDMATRRLHQPLKPDPEKKLRSPPRPPRATADPSAAALSPLHARRRQREGSRMMPPTPVPMQTNGSSGWGVADDEELRLAALFMRHASHSTTTNKSSPRCGTWAEDDEAEAPQTKTKTNTNFAELTVARLRKNATQAIWDLFSEL